MPYRPYFAFPEKIRRVIPDFAYCNAFYFNVFDPPRTLRPVDALDPPTTTVHPTPTSQVPKPSSVQDPGPTKTPSNIDPGITILPQPGHATHVSDPRQTDPGGDPGGDPGASGNPGPGGNADTGGDPSAGGDPSSGGVSGTGENSGTGGDPGTSNGQGDQPLAVVPAGELAAPTTKYSNTQHPINPVQNTPQSDLSDEPVHGDPGQGGGSTGITSQLDGISDSDSQGSNPQGSDPQSGDSQGGDPQGGNSQGSDAQNGDPQGSNGQGSLNSGSTDASDPGSSDPGSGSDSSGSGSHGSDPASNPQFSGGEDGSPTTIQLGHAGPTIIHLGNKGGNQQTTKGAAAITPGLDAPLFHPGQPDQPADPGSDVDSKAQPPVVTIASQVLTISNPSAIPIAGTVLTPGGQGVNVGGTPVTLGPSGNLVIGSSTPHVGGPSVLTIAGNIVTANPNSFSIAGTVVQAGQPAVTVSGIAVSLGSSGKLVVGGNTRPTPPLAITTNGIAVTFAPNNQVAVDGSTLSVGGPGVTVSGKHVSVGASGLIIGSTAIAIPTPASADVASCVLTIDGVAVTIASNRQVAVDGSTLSLGGPGVTISGKPVSIGSAALIIGSNTIAIPTTPASPLHGDASSVLNTDGQIMTFLPSSQVAVGGQTLPNGEQARTTTGVAASVVPAVLSTENSKTIPLPTITWVSASPSALTSVLSLPSSHGIIVDGQTLSIGGQAVSFNSGEIVLSLGSSGLVIDSDTIVSPTLPATAAATTVLSTNAQ